MVAGEELGAVALLIGSVVRPMEAAAPGLLFRAAVAILLEWSAAMRRQ